MIMPINSFENYPMSWKPDKTHLTSPLYLSIATLLEYDIINGTLAPQTKLPPQRELADFLDINLSTITRAFKICELKGLIYANTGKGTFVSPSATLPNVLTNHETPLDYIELGIIKPFYQLNSAVLATAKSVLNKKYAETLLEYSDPLGTVFQKQAAQKWLSRFQLNVPADNIAITSGAQNALTITLISLFQPGDKIVTDLYTHPNFKNLANLLNIQLIPVAGDEFGMSPDGLDTVCKLNNIKGIYLMPTYSNPTNITISMERRRSLAAIIKKHELTLIEDDVYAFLAPPEFIPITALIPEQSIYICGTSKSLCAGLRVAFIAFPSFCRSRIISGIYNINLKTPSLNTEIVAELIHRGSADKFIEKKIALVKERNCIFNQYFPASESSDHMLSFFQWLPLPKHLDGNQFEKLAKSQGVHVFCSDRFAVGNTQQGAFVRLAISSPTDSVELKKGLEIIKNLMQEKIRQTSSTEFIV